MTPHQPLSFEHGALVDFAGALFAAAGVEAGMAARVAEILVEADMMGHSTHGLALVPWYMQSIESGAMATSGDIEVVADRGACVTWKGNRLPGAWLTCRARDLAMDRAATYGTVTVAISEAHHIGALAAYLPRATENGMMALLSCSTPSGSAVAPYGGIAAVVTPNPIAAGIPTNADPVLIDISASITTVNSAKQLAARGERFPGAWVQDTQGRETDDPRVLLEGGTLLPVGGRDHGHKGYALALLVEALTQGLGGFGRADSPSGTSLSVFLQVIDPAAFGGTEPFIRQTSFVAEACRATAPAPGREAVRLPGQAAMAARRRALRDGVALIDTVVEALDEFAGQFDVPFPPALRAS